jgi:hypothetical protein
MKLKEIQGSYSMRKLPPLSVIKKAKISVLRALPLADKWDKCG